MRAAVLYVNLSGREQSSLKKNLWNVFSDSLENTVVQLRLLTSPVILP